MLTLNGVEQRALAAVARHFRSPLEWQGAPPTAMMTVNGGRVAVEVITCSKPGSSVMSGKKARLRDDRVARRFLSDLEAGVRAGIPDDRTMILTLGAPIKEPGRAVAALSEVLSKRLVCDAAGGDQSLQVLGNRVRYRVLSDDAAWTAKFMGFVFSGDPSPGDLADLLRVLQTEIAEKARTRTLPRSAGKHWLVLVDDGWVADIGTCRRGLSGMAVREGFDKILAVSEAGRVAALVGDVEGRQTAE